jgi:GNAT superfamily N-acetyltransferase
VTTSDGWSGLRPVTPADLVSCSRFSCCGSGGRFGATDIERQVRNGKALRRASLEPHHAFLGAFDEEGVLVAVAYHEPAPRERVGVAARYLRFIALADAYQGKGQGDRLLDETHTMIHTTHPDCEAVLVRVHSEHAGSIALIERNGYVRVPDDSGADPLFIRALP